MNRVISVPPEPAYGQKIEGKDLSYQEWAAGIVPQIREKMDWCCHKNQGKIPYTTDQAGNYVDRAADGPNGLSWWTNGFWGGILWLLYQDTGDEWYRSAAQDVEEKLNACFDDFYGLNHDVGFMYMPTAVADYKLTGNGTSRKRGLHAASLLAGRFNPAGRFLRAWDGAGAGEDTRGWAIIDCMCNLSLLYWASEETQDPRFRQIAMIHADTMIEHCIREDGSARHIMEFDPETGKYLGSRRGQGYAHGSAWSRGQGWAIYGFMISYIHTRREKYLRTAMKTADYCIAHIPESGLIPVDFCQPAEPAWEDSCGAAIIAGGLLEIVRYTSGELQRKYLHAAWKILNALYEKRTDFGMSCDAIVKNCTGAYHDANHHFAMNYGDYYFMEGIYKLAGTGIFLW